MWRQQPTRPEKGKWTKTRPALDWHLLSQGLLGGVLNLWFGIAFGRLVLKQVMRFDEDQAFLLDTHWHQVLGKRSQKVASGLAGHTFFLPIVVLSVVLEPLRWLTRWWMRRSAPARRIRGQLLARPPPTVRPGVGGFFPSDSGAAIHELLDEWRRAASGAHMGPFSR